MGRRKSRQPITDDSTALHILTDCDRTRAQEARRALRKLVWGPLNAHGVQLDDPSCPLSTHVDILSLQESAKVALTGHIWECTICGKMFSSEHFVDMHQARKHPDLRYLNGTVCLADLCDTYVPCVPALLPSSNSFKSLSSSSSKTSPHPTIKPLVSTTRLQSLNSTNFFQLEHQLPNFCHWDVSSRRQEQRRRIQICTNVVEDCLQSAIDLRQERLLFQRHFDRLKFELCQRASEVACVKRADFHVVVHPQHLRLKTSSGFPTLYLFVCFFIILFFSSALYCMCPKDIHAVDIHPAYTKRIQRQRDRVHQRKRQHARAGTNRSKKLSRAITIHEHVN